MKHKYLFATLVTALAITACQRIGLTDDPKVLTRPKAAAMIKRSSAFMRTIDINFEVQPNHQHVLVAQHFGYIEPDKSALTEKGKQAWRDLKLPVFDHTVPLASAEFVEVTGISTRGNAADVKFIWRWMPNEIGKSLVIGSPEFNALPDDLQSKIRQPPRVPMPGLAGPNAGIVFGGVRPGTANFQLYDDGWRARNVYKF